MILGLRKKLTLLIAMQGFILTAAIVTIQYSSLGNFADRVAGKAFALKLEADSQSVIQYIKTFFGKVFPVNGILVDRNLVPISGRDAMMNALREELGVESSLFILEENGFRRVLSSLEGSEGSFLDEKSPAFANVMNGGSYLGPDEVLGTEYFTSYSPLLGLDGEEIGLVFVGVPRALISGTVVEERRAMLIRIILAALAVAVLVGIIAELILTVSLAPLSRLGAALGAIASGGGARNGGTRSVEIPEGGNDEVGLAARSFNSFARSVASKLDRTALSLKGLDQAARDLAEGLGGIRTAASDIAAAAARAESETAIQLLSFRDSRSEAMNIAKMATGLADLSSSLHSSAGSSREAVAAMAGGLKSAAAYSAEGARLGADLRVRAAEGESRLSELADISRALTERQERLGSANELIAEVAGRTSILALNAAIEAAHAGVYGKGFEVLAGEIRLLAEATAERSREVSAVLEETMLLVDNCAAAAAGSETAFAEMADSLDLVEKSRSELEKKLSVEASSSSRVLAILNNMAELAGESALRSVSVRDAAVRVESSMGGLIDSSSQAGERIELIRGSLGSIELRIEAMRELGIKNEADVAAVAELVETFGSGPG
jgi:methyl-accepting chemotaxis protein